MFNGIIDAITRLLFFFFCRLNALKLTLLRGFAEVEGGDLFLNLFSENVLLASMLSVKGYEGMYIIYKFEFLYFVLYFLCNIVLSFIGMLTNIVTHFLGITLSTTPRSRLLINPPMEYTFEYEGWYIEIHNFVRFKIWSMICAL